MHPEAVTRCAELWETQRKLTLVCRRGTSYAVAQNLFVPVRTLHCVDSVQVVIREGSLCTFLRIEFRAEASHFCIGSLSFSQHHRMCSDKSTSAERPAGFTL